MANAISLINAARLQSVVIAHRRKTAVDIVTKPRTAPLSSSLNTRLGYPAVERSEPTPDDIANWQDIVNYMQAANPHELQKAKVFSGAVGGNELAKRLDETAYLEDEVDRLNGTRKSYETFFNSLRPKDVEQMEPVYFGNIHSVITNERSPGTLIHELGHGIDLTLQEGETPEERYERLARTLTLSKELAAWEKGQKAYETGAAADGVLDDEEKLKKFLDNTDSVSRIKYPSLGGYVGRPVGTAGGGLLGGAAGGVLGYILMNMLADKTNIRHWGIPQLGLGLGASSGVLLGGTIGANAGTAGGRFLASLLKGRNRKKAIKRVEETGKSEYLMDVRNKLHELKNKKTKGKNKSKDKDKDKKQRKAASLAKYARVHAS